MKLLLGGGPSSKPGWTNIDIRPLPTVDIVADLDKGIPLPDNSVDHVIVDYVLAHLENPVFIMEELYRVCVNGARIRIKTPYYKCHSAYGDPTIKHVFTEKTFLYWDHSYYERGILGYDFKCDMKIESLTYNYLYRGLKYIPGISIARRFLWDIVKNIVVILIVKK